MFFFGLVGMCLILQDLGDEPMVGLGVMKTAGISSGRRGFRRVAVCLPLFFWMCPDWAQVEEVLSGCGGGSVLW